MELSPEAENVLLRIYLGQNIRNEGILQSEIQNRIEAQKLLSLGFLRENHWHLDQFLTTEKGSLLASDIVKRKIEESRGKFREKVKTIPNKVLGFFNRRYVSENLASSAEKEYFDVGSYSGSWEDSILTNGRVWILWNGYFETLISLELCTKTRDYVSTRGGETRYLHYVISLEVRDFIVHEFATSDFTPSEERTLKLYSFLKPARRILGIDDVEQARQRFYELLKFFEVTEDQVAGIVNEMGKLAITSEYRGLLSESKPFDIMNPTSYEIYLSSNIIEPATRILLEGNGKIKEYQAKRRMPSLSEVRSESGILDDKELGDFYVMVSNLERQIREFLKERLGTSWEDRIENELSKVHESWREKRNKDNKWGIEPEKELINYSDLGDYISIVKQYSRIFSDGIEDLGDIMTYLKIWYNYGRNPIMHSRTVNRQKFYTTKSAVDFLSEWIRRKSLP